MAKYLNYAVIVLLMLEGINGNVGFGQKKEIHVSSPDKKLTVNIFVKDQRLSYSISAAKTSVIETSPLGLTVDGLDLGNQTHILSSPITKELNETYPLMGNHAQAVNHAIEAKIPLEASGRKFCIIVRVYNDGVAFRYTIPEGSTHIGKETTSWTLPGNADRIAWSEFSQSYEGFSHVSPVDSIPQNKQIMGPLTARINDFYLSISEADCKDFSDLAFVRNGRTLAASFPFAQQGWDVQPLSADPVLQGVYDNQRVSPWRTIIIAKSLTGLVNSDLLMNLCPAPAKEADFSWVKPGRCLWQWWSIGSPKYEDQKNWFDAAAKLHWEYYLIDDGWRYWKQAGKDQWALLKEVIDYGTSVGVKSIVWVDSKECRKTDERRAYLERVKAIGAEGIKIDFIPDATSETMQWYMETMQDCARLKLHLNFHGSVKPTGLRRTFPNDITREAVRGDEYHMSRYHRVMPLQQDVSLPFTRLMAGAADVTPVMLNPAELTSQKFTWAHEFAQAIVFLSPITHFADQYKFYIESPMFDLFQELPTTWDETLVLPCTEMGEVVAYARRKGAVWWIGVMNGATEREVKIPLYFIKGVKTGVLVYDTDINTSVDRRMRNVSHKETLTVKLIPGGGFVARIK